MNQRPPVVGSVRWTTPRYSFAADVARRLGTVILAVRAQGFETPPKADRSPVTEADHAAEKLIVA